jgi:hypothetical protein
MANGYSRSPKLLKGALVELSSRFIGPVPNIIVFQYNPETLTRTLTAWQPSGRRAEGQPAKSAATAQPTDPPESFTLTLELDATDDLEEGDPVTVISGVSDRIAALEMLLYPQEDSLLGDLVGAIGSALSGGAIAAPLPRRSVPIVLFVWGPGRIVPVRLTSFSVEEQAYSPTLYPIRARVSVGLKVLTPSDLKGHWDASGKALAEAAFNFTRKQKQVWAAANIANNVEAILGLLPF